MQLDPPQREFIDDFAAMWERFGASPAQGRILALLYIADESELSANDIAEALGLSRGSVSQHTRQLVLFNMIQRVSRPGERRDYFRVASNPFGEAARSESAQIETFINLFHRGLELHNTSPPQRKRALINSIAFLEDYETALGAFLRSWKPPTDSETP